MKGIVLAGGLGKRLFPLTKITNKHLLPVYDRPMICYPIHLLVDAGIEDILIVTGGTYAGDFLRFLGNGERFGLSHLNYAYQSGEGGIAEALGLAQSFVKDDMMVVVLGDNIFGQSIRSQVREWVEKETLFARIFLKKVMNPKEYGVVEWGKEKEIKRIVEKSENPPSDMAVLGVYLYPPDVFDIIKRLKPSARGELEITDVNNIFISYNALRYTHYRGWWMDAGESHDALLLASNWVKASLPAYLSSMAKGKKDE